MLNGALVEGFWYPIFAKYLGIALYAGVMVNELAQVSHVASEDLNILTNA